MLTFWFYNDWNSDIYWHIYAPPVVLKQTVESVTFCSVGPRLVTVSGITKRFVQSARYSTALYTVTEAGKIGISSFMSGIPIGNQSLLAPFFCDYSSDS